ncbi:flagellar basal body-associated FliL family protein [Halocynthiibacter sp. C4]|uniref:flagellar basal body-associated FliL family protein n=1 Tax=Halocynthiibacter sp. C4 TaxID=2992758 RepID=UPI00237B7767|nr:flagellar basal body-associated FliL family protein [Halocynthiibacter sp. C4]MDE0591341.1 flagellar basal body-associated FliL family protein [Halocynthiibacter sp. C4]
MVAQDSEKISRSSGAIRMVLLSLVLFLAGGAGSYFYFSMGTNAVKKSSKEHASETPDYSDVSFVPIEPLLISLNDGNNQRHLRFSAQIEVPKGKEKAVEALKPRIVDTLNRYLRALKVQDLERSNSLYMLRIQVLYRVQLIVGEENASDLLIMEFVLN